MNRDKRVILAALIAVIALTLGSGLLHGQLSNRWGASEEVLAAAKKLQKLPEQIGPWKAQASRNSSVHLFATAGGAAGVSRAYAHGKTGQIVNLAVLVGPAGPVSVQISDLSYSSRDYEVLGDPIQFAVRLQRSDEAFWRVDMRSRDIDAHILRLAYAWSRGNNWLAPAHPRMAFGGQPLLFKLQLAAKLPPSAAALFGGRRAMGPSEAEVSGADPCREFLQDFLPAFDMLVAASPAD